MADETVTEVEEWRKYREGTYEVSNLGRVRRNAPGISTYIGRVLFPSFSPTGYLQAALSLPGVEKQKREYVHRMVAEAFHGPPPSDMHVVNHKDTNKQNNRIENLEWVTYKENVAHALLNVVRRRGEKKPRKPLKGGPQRGENHWMKRWPERVARGDRMPHTKLNPEMVRSARQRVAAGEKQITVAREMGVCVATMSRVIQGKRWIEQPGDKMSEANVTKVLNQSDGDKWIAYHADTVDVAKGLPSGSVDFSVYSPPFENLYCYGASDRDFGNSKQEEFTTAMRFLAVEQFRVMRPGRVMAIHCMMMPTSKERDGYIGLKDFRGDLIRLYQSVGFIFHSEVCIWKDPPTQMQRTKSLGLLHKTLRKDSSMSRQALADYLVVMRTPGVNDSPIDHTAETFPVERWQRYASCVWAFVGGTDDEGFAILSDRQDPTDPNSGIDPGDTLQYRSAREHADERHVAPLQLEVARRAIRLWSKPGDTVWSPFGGIGSEGYVALQEGRKSISAELKASYFSMACENLRRASSSSQPSLFAMGSK